MLSDRVFSSIIYDSKVPRFKLIAGRPKGPKVKRRCIGPNPEGLLLGSFLKDVSQRSSSFVGAAISADTSQWPQGMLQIM